MLLTLITFIFLQRNINFRFKETDLRQASESDLDPSVVELTSGDLIALFQNSTVTKRLFPCEMLLNKFMGYKLMAGNIKYLVNDQARVYASLKPSNKDNRIDEKNTTDVTKGNLKKEMLSRIDMISFLSWHFAQKGVVCAMDVYSSSDISSLKSHIDHHTATVLPDIVKSSGFLMMSYHDQIQDSDVIPLLSQNGINDRLHTGETQKCWFEKELS